MKKNGFTLVEVLAVIVILSILVSIATVNIIGVRDRSLKDLLETKKQNLEAAAIVYGQEHQEELTEVCTVDDYKSNACLKVTVKDLIDKKYFKSTETNENEKIELINNVTNKSMLNDEIQIYRKNNHIYAKYSENNVSEN